MIRSLLILFLMTTMLFCSAYKKPFRYEIKAEPNAYVHNNKGLNYLKDRVYYAAVQEFKIAISLSPSTQASAIFYNNLGETYMFMQYPDLALDCFENAVKLYGLNFKYYINLANCYIAKGIAENKIKEFSTSQDVYDRIKLGILYVKSGEIRKGINTLDEICVSEPDLLITPAIKQYIREIIRNNPS